MGVLMSQPCALNTASVVLRRHDSSVGTVRQGASAPSATLRLRSGMSRAGIELLAHTQTGALRDRRRGAS